MYRDFSIQQVGEWQWVGQSSHHGAYLTAATEAGLMAAIDQYLAQKGAK